MFLPLRSESDKAIIAILSLAATIPMVTGKIDLTVGYGIVLWHILAISLQTLGLPWPVACLIVLALGAFSGLLNGLLVEVACIDRFIATLGTGTVLYALALWHTGGRQLVDEMNRALAGEPWSGYVSPLHVVTTENIEFDGGPENRFDPGNGYKDAYLKIWKGE